MFQLLSTYWLWALTGLLVPVFIHLWNKKQPKVIKVGSIRWLQAAASQQARQLQLHAWPLLLLRCLLLAALVVSLCQPVWQQFTREPDRKYVWVAPSLLRPQTLPLVQATIDSLLKKNYTLGKFAFDFTPIQAETWQNLKDGAEERPEPAPKNNYWALAKAVHQQFPRAQEHLILTDNQLGHFSGKRPVLPSSSRWLIIPVNQTDSLFVQEAFEKNADSLTVVVGQGNNSGIQFTNFSFPTPGQTLTPAGLLPLVYVQTENQAFISLKNSTDQIPVRKQNSNIKLVYDRNREQDINYLRAALTAVGDYTDRSLQITPISAARQIQVADTDWLFWLSDQPLPNLIQAEINKGLIVFKDAPSTAKPGAASYLTTAQLPENISLAQQVRMAQQTGSSVWQNNFGEPVLQFRAMGRGGIYTFGSRFNTQWNNLTGSSFFPELLGNLVFPETKIRRDFRELENHQVQPILARTTQAQTFRTEVKQDLKLFFLALGAFLFLMERFWAFQKGRRHT